MSNTLHKVFIRPKEEMTHPKAQQLIKTVHEFYQFPLDDLQIDQLFHIKKPLSKEQLEAIASGPLVDPILEESATSDRDNSAFDWTVEVGLKQGLTDNTGKTAQTTIEDFLGISFSDNETVHALTQYNLKGDLTFSEVRRLSEELLANPLVEEIAIRKHMDFFVEEINLNVSDVQLLEISKDRGLALQLNEMQTIRDYYRQPEVIQAREAARLSKNPTDVEIEAIAQTWSEHCKHKIFNALISYSTGGKTKTIDSLFKSYIKQTTNLLKEKCDWLVSVFDDNAGIIEFDEKFNLAFKVETHNSPSALDPYGGALTGILGVNRDIMGAGLGARLLANTDVFCFAPPNYNKALPPRIIHPKRIFEGVRRGVEHGGNKSGVPTVNGALVFDERYLGKPLVYCGSLGIMPREIDNTPTHHKEIHPGDLIVIAGGRTGKDGIHGATFSSEALHSDSPLSAVQIGDPFTQKKLHDFIMDARDQLLYRTLTDNGAGGFSSSVGELATLSGGCELYLDRALLKYEGLHPWEILVSESQERMTLAVSSEKMEELQKLADMHEVEICTVGTFTASGNFHVLHSENTVALLPLDFLHDGVPQLQLEAHFEATPEVSLKTPEHFFSIDLHHLLERYNICSKEPVIRQYDHEVQASTVVKPLQGIKEDGPGDAAVILPVECSEKMQGVVISNGICPRYSDLDTYHMAANAIDEAVRNAVAVGCDPKTIAILDNFCWSDPVFNEQSNPEGKHKLGQLVRACQALHDTALAFETPIISGKDSMKNDYKMGSIQISVPPTLLISAIGKIPDISHAVSMDMKCAGDWVYVVGVTKNELGGSEYAQMKQLTGGSIPKVDPTIAKTTYSKLFEAIQSGLIASCHDCSEGGLGVALVESAFSGDVGIDIDLHSVPMEDIHNDTELLFSESASRFVVTVSPENARHFETIMSPVLIGRIGLVQKDPHIKMIGIHGETLIDEEINNFKLSWKKTLGGAS